MPCGEHADRYYPQGPGSRIQFGKGLFGDFDPDVSMVLLRAGFGLTRVVDSLRDQIWSFYAELKVYKKHPTLKYKEELHARFDAIFTQRTQFETLNQTLKRIHRNKAELLLVLERPDVPLHTNGSEGDIRDYVKKNKASGGTRSDTGRRCRDTFTSLKKTCRKLGISFWDYLKDRISRANEILALAELIELKATSP